MLAGKPPSWLSVISFLNFPCHVLLARFSSLWGSRISFSPTFVLWNILSSSSLLPSLYCPQPFHLSLHCLFCAVLVPLLPCVIILTFGYLLRPASPRNRPPSVSCLQSSPGSNMQNVECIPRQQASCPPSCSDTLVPELTEEKAGRIHGVVQAEFASTARGQRCFC